MKRGEETLPRKAYHEKESVGVADGLSERSDFMSNQRYNDAAFNTSSANSGNAGFQRDAKGQRKSKSVSSKGLSFEIDGCGDEGAGDDSDYR